MDWFISHPLGSDGQDALTHQEPTCSRGVCMHSPAQPAQVLCRQPDSQHSVCGGQHCDRQPYFRLLSIVHGMWSHLCAARGGQAPALSPSRGLLPGLQVSPSSFHWSVGMCVQLLLSWYHQRVQVDCNMPPSATAAMHARSRDANCLLPHVSGPLAVLCCAIAAAITLLLVSA